MNPVCLVCGDVPTVVTYPGTPEYYCHLCWDVLGDVPSETGYVPTGIVWELDCVPGYDIETGYVPSGYDIETGYVPGGYDIETGYVPGDAEWDRVSEGGYADDTEYVPGGISDVLGGYADESEYVPGGISDVLGGYADESEYVPGDAEYVPSDIEWDRVSEDAYPLEDVGYVLAR